MRTDVLESTVFNKDPQKNPRGPGFAPFCCLFISSLQRSLNICGKTPKAYISLKFMYFFKVINTQYLTLYT